MPNDSVILLVSPFDPPTVDHRRAADVLSLRPGLGRVWLAPLGADGHRLALCTIMATEMSSAGRRVSVCSSGASSLAELLEWARAKYPAVSFETAAMAHEDVAHDAGIVLYTQSDDPPEARKRAIALSDRRTRGVNEAVVGAAAWRYIRAHKLYGN
jgi:hypothetical protein